MALYSFNAEYMALLFHYFSYFIASLNFRLILHIRLHITSI